uniref:Uncharacterized protein n=1 Tax=Myotis myotis TaxID=51298 RepID=A0A7J7ZXX9_MYOMY|nr:hypothetical protein mMyoMyo1_009947 [Myotis myotis]
MFGETHESVVMKAISLQNSQSTKKKSIYHFPIGESRLSLGSLRYKVQQQLTLTASDRQTLMGSSQCQCIHLWARFLFTTWFCTINLILLFIFLRCIIIPSIIKHSGYLGEFLILANLFIPEAP